MIQIIQVMVLDDEGNFKFLVILIAAILIISLLINAFLASDLRSLSTPPIRMQGYLTSNGDPSPGYYVAPDSLVPGSGDPGYAQTCK
jgi:hypothetical protein